MNKLKPNIIEQEVVVKNKNASVIKKIDFFNKISTWFNDPDLEVRVSGISYIEFNQGVISEAYHLNCISIVSENKEQCEKSFNLNYREANGKEHNIALSPVLDRFQITSQIESYAIPRIEFNGLNTLEYYVLPNTEVRVYFELDKSNSISEAFKIIHKINDFSKPIIEELILNEKVKDCTTCEDTPPKIVELPVPDMAKEAREAMDFKLNVPSKPCKQDPYILEYAVKIKNKGSVSQSVSMFNRTTIIYPTYKFVLPYSANYPIGFYVEIATDNGLFRYDVVQNTSRSDLVAALNTLGIGQWQLDQTDNSNNVYTCFSITHVISNLFYDVTAAIIITQQPISQNAHETDSFTLTITATGANLPLSYQWRKNGGNVGSNSNTFTVSNVAVGDAGNYDCVITDALMNTVTSDISVVGVLHWVAKTSGVLTNINKVFGI